VTCGGAFVVVVVVPFRVVVVPFRLVEVVPVVVVPFDAVVVVFAVVGFAADTGVDAAGFRARTFVVILVEHVSRVPPLLPVPLHWLTRTGIAALTLDVGDTEQTAAEPPPVTEPLH
jgi:hypothetical protein